MRRAWLLLSSLVAACSGSASDIPSDRATAGFSGALASMEMAVLALPPSSPQLDALAADPEGWLPADAAAGVERTDSRVVFDADGWIRELSLGWEGDQGWKIRMSLDGPVERRPPSRVEVRLMPPEGSGQAPWPMGEGDIRYAGPERVLRYEGERPGIEGRESFERRTVLDGSGRLQLEESTTTAPDGGITRKRREVLARDARGLAMDELELLDGVGYRVSIRNFLPDGQGNPRRVVRLYRLADAAADAPVQRAEVNLRAYRYQDETR